MKCRSRLLNPCEYIEAMTWALNNGGKIVNPIALREGFVLDVKFQDTKTALYWLLAWG